MERAIEDGHRKYPKAVHACCGGKPQCGQCRVDFDRMVAEHDQKKREAAVGALLPGLNPAAI
jgi:hypothetical protein